MAQWQYNQVGYTYNKVGLQYNFFGSVLATATAYYTGGISASKRFLRGMGF